METEILFTASKWGILKQISNKPSSPLEIANTLGTTIANVSQQLRLLEASGLVAKKKVPSSEPGKPRALFSLTGNFAFLTVLSEGQAQKELVSITKDQQFQLNLWMYGDKGIVGPLTKLYYTKEKLFDNISELLLKSVIGKTIILEDVISSDDTFTAKKTEKFDIIHGGVSYSVTINRVKQKTAEYVLIKEVGD